MSWIFENDRPIYIQLVEQLKIAIIKGQYKSGEKIPSVREIANDAKVNPNTMQKALSEIEDLGLIYTKRTSGKYVTEDKKLLKKYRENYAKEKIKQFLKDMEPFELDINDLISLIEKEEKGE